MLFVTGCGSDDADETGSSTTAGGSPITSRSDLEGTITVSAAASLREAFDRIGDGFSTANPGVEVTFNFDSSSTLSTQILEGAPADVYASADVANMTKLTDESLIAGDPEIFARNELVIITKPGNPRGIATLADLADAGVISLCGEDVPCGRYAKEALDNAGVTIPESSVTRGQNATAALAAVAEGDAVAGVVYVTDAVSAGDTVEAVSPADVNVIADYPIGVLEASGAAEVAEAFVAYVLGDEGQAVLAENGFLPPA
ncbi:MAG: molybdate ABC transporter substrate-binding protein [Acidimicrobiales bacterium]|nr:molybdate ABC transporter substrate-binding protein [Acidimicrobiales bacterium]